MIRTPMSSPEFSLAGSVPPTSPGPEERAEPADWLAAEVLPHEPLLRSWLRSRFPSLAEGDDVVQESYVRLIRAREHHPVANAKSYLFRVAHNITMDLFRRQRVLPMVPATEAQREAVAEDRAGVAETVCTAQEVELLRQAIDALPDRCRQIMVLQKLQGCSNQEIAGRLGLSINTVNAQLVIGLARCRQYLLARGVLRGSRP